MERPILSPSVVTAGNVEQVLAAHGCHGPDFGVLPHVSDFRESGTKSKDEHPLFPMSTEFPFEATIRNLDGEADEQADEPRADSTVIERATVARMLLGWIGQCRSTDVRAVNYIGKRAIAALWILNPERFGDAPARDVARAFGIPHTKFSQETAEFSRKFGIKNRHQGKRGRPHEIAPEN